MYALCRAFGHKASRHRIQRDPLTFIEHSICKRCGAELVRNPNLRWEERVSDRATA